MQRTGRGHMRFYDDKCITDLTGDDLEPTDHVDEQVRGWMKAKGWEVTATDYAGPSVPGMISSFSTGC